MIRRFVICKNSSIPILKQVKVTAMLDIMAGKVRAKATKGKVVKATVKVHLVRHRTNTIT